jgi:hypothetical protein
MKVAFLVAVGAIAVSIITPAVAQISNPIAVPEPSTLTVMAGGMAVALLLRRKKK